MEGHLSPKQNIKPKTLLSVRKHYVITTDSFKKGLPKIENK